MFSQLSRTTRGTEMLYDILTVVIVTNRSTGLWDMVSSQRLPWPLKYWNVRYDVFTAVTMTEVLVCEILCSNIGGYKYYVLLEREAV